MFAVEYQQLADIFHPNGIYSWDNYFIEAKFDVNPILTDRVHPVLPFFGLLIEMIVVN